MEIIRSYRLKVSKIIGQRILLETGGAWNCTYYYSVVGIHNN